MSGLIATRHVSRRVARIGMEAAVRQADALGCRACVAIVDGGGRLISFDRMDGAPFQSAQHAQDKAISSAGNELATDEMWALVEGEPQLRFGVLKVQGLSVLGGGLPIRHGGELVGAIGVSGSCGMAEDRTIGEAAIAAILATLEETSGEPPAQPESASPRSNPPQSRR